MGYLETKNKLRRTATHLGRRLSGKQRIIASLTSYPPRIGTVDKAIRSLLSQKVLPDKVVLYLYRGDFPEGEADLPDQLRQLLAHDVVVRWVELDLKSHKKWFWAFKDYPNDLVLLFDDDLVYRNDLVAELVNCHRKFPNSVCASRSHFIVLDEAGCFLPYDKWIFEAPVSYPELVGKPSPQLFVTTGAGTLFPPGSVPERAFDIDSFSRLCMNADDVWINEMLRQNNVKVVAATAKQELEYIPDTQDVALCHQNLDAGGNDAYFQAIADELYEGSPKKLAEGYTDASLADLNATLLADSL